jgi:hypothetical protein
MASLAWIALAWVVLDAIVLLYLMRSGRRRRS